MAQSRGGQCACPPGLMLPGGGAKAKTMACPTRGRSRPARSGPSADRRLRCSGTDHHLHVNTVADCLLAPPGPR
jgi:hypothetical protein